MFNIGPGEIIIVALVLLMAVGPEQLPGVIRRVGRSVSQVRSMTEGLRSDFMAGMDEIERATDPNSWAGSAGPSSEDKPPKKHSAVMTATEANAIDNDADKDSAAENDADKDSAAENDADKDSAAENDADNAAEIDADEDHAIANDGDEDGESGTEPLSDDASDTDSVADPDARNPEADGEVDGGDMPSTNGAAAPSPSNGNGTQPGYGPTDDSDELIEDGADRAGEEEQA